MAGSGSFTAETLAFRAGVPLRTVRFYIQEKLLDPPLGRGRGAHFTHHHLVQLQQARTLQNAGFSLESIRERRAELTVGLHAMEAFDAAGRRWAGGASTELAAAASSPGRHGELDPKTCVRISMAEGVELMVSQDRLLPSPRQLLEIALHVRKAFASR